MEIILQLYYIDGVSRVYVGFSPFSKNGIGFANIYQVSKA